MADSSKIQRPWSCPNGHVVGYLVRHGRVDKLHANHEGFSIVTAYEIEVTCPKCGAVRTFFPGEAALQQLGNRLMSTGAKVYKISSIG